jgi:hypothetical protein
MRRNHNRKTYSKSVSNTSAKKTAIVEKSLLITLCAVMILGAVILSLASRSVYSSDATAKETAKRSASTSTQQMSRTNMAAATPASSRSLARFFPWAQDSRLVNTESNKRASLNHTLARFFPMLVGGSVTATKTDSLVGDVNGNNVANPGDTLKYTVTITNPGGTDATGVAFNDTPDPNTALVPGSVMTTPLALSDSYQAIGNVQITIPAPGVLANDADPDGVGPALTASAGSTSTQGGNVSVNSNGGFTYNPPAGFEGNDTFTYTLNDGEGNTTTGTVTIAVSGMIWFVNNNAGAPGSSPGDGRITNPFKTLAAFNAVNDGAGNHPAQNDNIFLYESPTSYVGPVNLLNGQALIGQDATISLSAITGLTEPTGSDPLPAMNSGNATIVNITDGASGINLAQNNLIRGLNVGDTTGTDITGSNFGMLTVADVSLTGTGRALNLNTGTLAASFNSIASVNSTTTGISLTSVMGTLQVSGTTTIDNAAGIGINIASVPSIPVGTLIQFGTVNVLNRNATGILVDDVDNANNTSGGVVFGTTTIANPHNAGGFGVKVQNSSMNVSFSAANVSGTKQTIAETDANSDGIPETEGDGDAVFLTNNTGSFTLSGGTLQDLDDDGIDVRSSGNITLTGVTIQRPNRVNNSLQPGHHGFYANELKGTNTIQNSTIQEVPSGGSGLRVINVTQGSTLTLDHDTFTQPAALVTKTGDSFVLLQGGGTTTNSLIVTNTCDFSNLQGHALQTVAGITPGSTATVNTTIQNSSFHDAALTTGFNGVELNSAQAGTQNILITGSTFNNLTRPSALAGVISITGAGGNLLGTIGGAGALKNTITNSGTGTAGRRGIHLVSEPPVGFTGSVDVTIDNNDFDGFLDHQAIFADLRTTTGNSELRIINNRIGQITGTVGGSRRALEVVSQGSARTFKAEISNNLITGTTTGSARRVVDLNSFDNSDMSVTFVGNTLRDKNAAGTPTFKALTQDFNATGGTPKLCLDLRNNTASSGVGTGNGSFQLTRTDGIFTQNNSGNTPAPTIGAGVTANGGSCPLPVAFLRGTPNGISNPNGSNLIQMMASLQTAPANSIYPLASSNVSAPVNSGRNQRRGSVALNHPTARTAKNISPTAVRNQLMSHAVRSRPVMKPLAPVSGDVNLSIGTLPAGQSITITFNVTINDPFTGGAQVSNQGTVSGSNFSDVLTDDPDFPGTADPTVTPVVVPNSAPVLLDTAVALNNEAEDAGAPVGAVGTLVSSLVDLNPPAGGQDNVTDSDPTPVTGMAIVGSDTTNGSWFYSINNGANWLPLGAVSNASARVLKADASTRLYFQPGADFNGTVTSGLTFRAWDQSNSLANGTTGVNTSPNGGSTPYSTATDVAAITITEVNDAPDAVNDSLSSVAEDSGTRTIPFSALTGNDSTGPANESGQTLTITSVGNAVGGTVSISGTDVLFTPTADYNGPASFDYTVQDDGTTSGVADPKTDTASVSFSITEVNDAPDAVDDTLSSVAENSGTQTIPIATLLANDSKGPANESSQTLTLTAVSSAVGGTVTFDATNVYFTPTANYNGPASFQYTIEDNGTTNGAADPKTDTATVSFSITEVNAAPDAVDDSLSSVAEDSGTRTIPIATLLANDSAGPNESGQTLTLTAVGGAVGGTVSFDATNVYFTPAADFNGAASFQYTVTDNGTTNGVADPKSDTASVSFTITEVNDVPDAVDDALSSVAENSGTRTIPISSLLGNDSTGPANESGQTLTLTSVSGAVGGTVSFDATNVYFTPAASYNGTASFQYTIADNGTTNGAADPKTDAAIVSFSITEVNDAPNAVDDSLSSVAEDSGTRTIPIATLLANDSAGPANESGQTLTLTAVGGAVGGTVAFDATNVYFTPAADFNGAASFQYTVTDNGTTNGAADPKSDTATVSFTVTEVNDAPDAVDDALSSIAEDSGTRTIPIASLLGNDSKGPANESSQTLTLTAVSSAVGGTVTFDATNVYFTPTANYNGPASFQYTVTDNGTTNGAADPKSDTASVSFTITPVNDAPVANAGPDQTVGCTAGVVTLDGTASFDVDDNSNTLTYVWKEGSTVIATGATATVVLPVGVHTITLTVTDPHGASSQDTVVITVADNSLPTITLTNQVVTLWPPNHQYVTFNLNTFVASASDSCDASVDINDVVILKVTSDEVENGNGDGNTLKDIIIAANCKSVQLRSERDGSANGRVYTITFLVRDTAGNTTTATAKVTVPKSQNGAAAVDDGPHYTVTSNCP